MAKIDFMQASTSSVDGKLGYLLLLVTVAQFSYPITQYGLPFLILFQFLYVSMIVVGVIVARDNRLHVAICALTGVAYLLAGIWYSFDVLDPLRQLTAYVVILPFQITLIYILFRFILRTRTVTRDVVYAAATVYLLLGGVFTVAMGVVETMQPGSFVDGSATPGALLEWQQIIYFSYVSLTTAGYGDILPISWWARALATLESVVGVLYLAVIMARLVGLYAVEAEQGISEQ